MLALIFGAFALVGFLRCVALARRALARGLASMRATMKRALKRKPRTSKGQSDDLARAVAMLAYAIAAQNGQASKGRLP